ncbi:NAD(P)-binding domain-containing protein [Streptomyces sp. NPDC057199]|uniref:NAD(P)-binding domain-containing protein n=1 Tax=Streptomyces sp. NPDC057199 TaxID=3346047 RepID=UPI0036361ED0
MGFIESGYIGSALARLAIEAGHRVVLSNSRGPETLADTVAELGPRASAATSGEAAAAGDIVVVTVPVKATVTEFIESIGYGVVDAGPLTDSWRQATGTPVWGTPYGPYSNEKGRPVD